MEEAREGFYILEAAEPGKKKRGVLDYNDLSRHGYKGGLSVLKVRPPKVVNDSNQDWSWSTGKREINADAETIEESYDDRERTRAAANVVEKLSTSQPSILVDRKDKKNMSFSQKEKRKRDLGQASRGKNYVEEEKRMLRESGVYSGFDS
ncbi:hypothetical protein Taro_046864 [Colocasia esculenta]|uniref:Uncharacterized protein n=1 Tax=Colocasia esculenta TaxID=4460 RepID=A0A843WZQ6_COLES|nr:hypothetical protein [Colocasia esculenta]